MIRAGLTKLLAAWAITSASAAQAQGPDIDGWLARPGVRLLAIDFLPIAGACDECRAAVPRYRALRQRYAAAGLEVLLVVPETDDGCTPPDWPSELVYCDVGGTFARRLKVFEPMQALLMDWQGQRLVDHGTFDEVDKAAQAWLRAHPSVQLDVRTPPAGVSADDLRSLMARALQTVNGIKPPVATQSRARAPAAVCPPSDRSPAPTVLQVDTTPGDPGPKLAATLWPVGETCRLGSIVIPWDAAQPAKTVQQIARALLPRAAR